MDTFGPSPFDASCPCRHFFEVEVTFDGTVHMEGTEGADLGKVLDVTFNGEPVLLRIPCYVGFTAENGTISGAVGTFSDDYSSRSGSLYAYFRPVWVNGAAGIRSEQDFNVTFYAVDSTSSTDRVFAVGGCYGLAANTPDVLKHESGGTSAQWRLPDFSASLYEITNSDCPGSHAWEATGLVESRAGLNIELDMDMTIEFTTPYSEDCGDLGWAGGGMMSAMAPVNALRRWRSKRMADVEAVELSGAMSPAGAE